MSEPAQQGIQLSHGIAAAIGAAFLGLLRVGWNAIQKGNQDVVEGLKAQIVDRDKRIAVLEADVARKEETIEKLGAKKDAVQAQLETFLNRAAGVVYRVHQDSRVDDSTVEDMPTAVHERAKLFAGGDPHAGWGADPHPSKPWDVNASTPPGGHPKPPRPRPK